ncbi:MAG: hypothetical protein JHC32_00885 [Candidatus Aminicenantes bacterium]|nr:hypothetical protein [Candidatus Aminicenantes bacterium]
MESRLAEIVGRIIYQLIPQIKKILVMLRQNFKIRKVALTSMTRPRPIGLSMNVAETR